MAEQQSVGTIEGEGTSGASGKRQPIFKAAFSDSRSRMMVVLMLTMAVAAIVVAWAFYSIFMQAPQTTSAVGGAPSGVDSTAGGEEDSEVTKLLVEQDDQRAQEAQKDGRSMIATLTHLSQSGTTKVPPPRTSKPKPPPERQIEEAPKSRRKAPQTKARAQATQKPREINQDIARSIENIMAASRIDASSTQVFDRDKDAGQVATAQNSRGERLTRTSRKTGDTANQGTSQQDNRGRVIIPATALRYAVMENTANSDVKGPIIARIVQGKYRGGRLLGSFDRSQTYLRIEFDSLTAPEIGTVGVKAIAVNPDNSSIGLATAVNHHFLERYGGLVLGGFIAGFGEAVAQSGSTTTTSAFGSSTTQRGNYDTGDELAIAAGGAAQAAGDRLASTTQRPITVKVARGTPIGVRFLDDVRLDVRNSDR